MDYHQFTVALEHYARNYATASWYRGTFLDKSTTLYYIAHARQYYVNEITIEYKHSIDSECKISIGTDREFVVVLLYSDYRVYLRNGGKDFLGAFDKQSKQQKGKEVNEEGAIYRAITTKIKRVMPLVDPDAALTAYKIVQRIQATEMHPEDSLLVQALSDELGPPPAIPQYGPMEGGGNPNEGDAWVQIATQVDKIIQEGLEKPQFNPAALSVDMAKLQDYNIADMYYTQKIADRYAKYAVLPDFKFSPVIPPDAIKTP